MTSLNVLICFFQRHFAFVFLFGLKFRGAPCVWVLCFYVIWLLCDLWCLCQQCANQARKTPENWTFLSLAFTLHAVCALLIVQYRLAPRPKVAQHFCQKHTLKHYVAAFCQGKSWPYPLCSQHLIFFALVYHKLLPSKILVCLQSLQALARYVSCPASTGLIPSTSI